MKPYIVAMLACAACAFGVRAQDINPDWPIEGDGQFRTTVVNPDFSADGLYYHIIPGSDGEVALMNNHSLVIHHAAELTLFLEALDWTVDAAPSGDIEVPAVVSHGGKSYDVTMVLYGAFAKAADLRSVRLPESVREIRGGIFGGCASLTQAGLPQDLTALPDWTFTGCNSLRSVDLTPYESIGVCALAGCFGLETVATTGTPRQVEALAERFATRDAMGTAPDLSGSLRTVYVTDAAAASTVSASYSPDAFTDSEFASATLCVPAGTREAFVASAFWNRFANIEEKTYAGVNDPVALPETCAEVFDITGRRLGVMAPADMRGRLGAGIYVLRSTSGTCKKLYIK